MIAGMVQLEGMIIQYSEVWAIDKDGVQSLTGKIRYSVSEGLKGEYEAKEVKATDFMRCLAIALQYDPDDGFVGGGESTEEYNARCERVMPENKRLRWIP